MATEVQTEKPTNGGLFDATQYSFFNGVESTALPEVELGGLDEGTEGELGGWGGEDEQGDEETILWDEVPSRRVESTDEEHHNQALRGSNESAGLELSLQQLRIKEDGTKSHEQQSWQDQQSLQPLKGQQEGGLARAPSHPGVPPPKAAYDGATSSSIAPPYCSLPGHPPPNNFPPGAFPPGMRPMGATTTGPWPNPPAPYLMPPHLLPPNFAPSPGIPPPQAWQSGAPAFQQQPGQAMHQQQIQQHQQQQQLPGQGRQHSPWQGGPGGWPNVDGTGGPSSGGQVLLPTSVAMATSNAASRAMPPVQPNGEGPGGRGPSNGQWFGGRGGGPDGGGGGQPGMVRSQYMSVEEMQSIIRMQWAAVHAGDPYVDDYYHQAVQQRKASAAGMRLRHFAPASLQPPGSLQRGNGQQQHQPSVSFVPIQGLGRVPIPSIRRPRPLLEMEPLSTLHSPPLDGMGGKGDAGQQQQQQQPVRPLDQEPMLAARMAIEEGMNVLLDVDDIDRLLTSPQPLPPHAAAQLHRTRHLLLETLAASLQLSDPLIPGSPLAPMHDSRAAAAATAAALTSAGPTGGWGARGASGRGASGAVPPEDVVWLRLSVLPKGRKFLSRFFSAVPGNSPLQRILLLAVFRHFRILFSPSAVGSFPLDPASTTEAAALSLPTQVVRAVQNMASLDVAAGCLAALVLAPEPPPFASHTPAGRASTLVLRTLLDRAANLRAAAAATANAAACAAPPGQQHQLQYQLQQQLTAWQVAFDSFFDRLSSALCFRAILSSLPLPASAAAAVSKEMPLELLRSALPHTSQHQRDQVGALLQGLLRSSNSA